MSWRSAFSMCISTAARASSASITRSLSLRAEELAGKAPAHAVDQLVVEIGVARRACARARAPAAHPWRWTRSGPGSARACTRLRCDCGTSRAGTRLGSTEKIFSRSSAGTTRPVSASSAAGQHRPTRATRLLQGRRLGALFDRSRNVRSDSHRRRSYWPSFSSLLLHCECTITLYSYIYQYVTDVS